MGVDIDVLTKAFFYVDEPVPYKLTDKDILYIYPVSVKDSEVFSSSCDILQIDKNSLASVEIIQMSYLDFLLKVLIPSDESKIWLDKLFNVMRLCLRWDNWTLNVDNNQKISLVNEDNGFKIKARQFDDIKRIILYQNLLHYDDEYIDPDLKKAIEETNKLRAANIVAPSLERRISIVTAHCGLPKREQLAMTMRAHQSLFEECSGEVDYTTTKPIALYAGKAKDVEWIYKSKKDKYSDYIMTLEDYNKSMGGDGQVADGKIRASKNMPFDGAALDAMYDMNINSK